MFLIAADEDFYSEYEMFTKLFDFQHMSKLLLIIWSKNGFLATFLIVGGAICMVFLILIIVFNIFKFFYQYSKQRFL